MEKVEIEKYKDMAMRRMWWIIIPFLLSLLIGLAWYLKLPKIYRASTLILVQSQKIPAGYVREIVSINLEERIRTITQQITSRSNLENIINQFHLFSGPGKQMLLEDKIDALRKKINVNVSRSGRRSTNAFEVFFTGNNPQQVADIANTLASYFITENLKLREDQAVGTTEFLIDELENVRRRLVEKEKDVQAFREKYMGRLPGQLETNLRVLERLQRQMVANQENLRETENTKLMVQQELAAAAEARKKLLVPPETAGEREQTLDNLKAQLTALEARYTDKHPDVVRLRQKIADLQSMQTNTPAEQPEQPAQRELTRTEKNLMARLQEIQLKIANMKTEATNLEAQIQIYQKRVEDTPKLEQELMSLNRDYRNLQGMYDSLLNRKLEAEIALNLERKQKGEQFVILDPARPPIRPFRKDVYRQLMMIIALGFGLGCGLAYLREIMDTSFRKPEEIEDSLHVPVIASLPFTYSVKELRSMKRKKVAGVVAVGLSFIILAVLIVVSSKGVEGTIELIKEKANIFLGI